jgi:hypothetical protein
MGALFQVCDKGQPFQSVEKLALRRAGGSKGLHALAATAPPTAARRDRRDEGKNVSCGESFVKVAESTCWQTTPILSGIFA